VQIKLSEQSVTNIVLFIVAYLIAGTAFVINMHNRVNDNSIRFGFINESVIKVVNNLDSIRQSTHDGNTQIQILNTKFESFMRIQAEFRDDVKAQLKDLKK